MRFILGILLIAVFYSEWTLAQSVVGDVIRLRSTTLPGTCNVGDMRTDASEDYKLKQCYSGNVWRTIAPPLPDFPTGEILFGDGTTVPTSSSTFLLSGGNLTLTSRSLNITGGDISLASGRYLTFNGSDWRIGRALHTFDLNGGFANANSVYFNMPDGNAGYVWGVPDQDSRMELHPDGVLWVADHFEGELQGNVTGDLFGNVVGDVIGNIVGNLTGNADTATALAADPAACAANRYVTDTAANGDLTCSQVSLSAGVTGTLPVGNGGTGATTLTNHGVLLGQGTSAIAATSVGATGTVLAGNTGADPSFSSGPIGLTSLGINDTGATSSLYVKTSAIGTPSMTIKAIGSQTADLLQVIDSAGVEQMIFTSGGNFRFFHNVNPSTTRFDLRGSISQSSVNSGNNARYGMFIGDPTALAANVGSGIALGGRNTSSAGSETPYGYIWVNKDNATPGDVAGSLHFATRNNSTGLVQRALELNSSGDADFFGTAVNLNGSSSGKVSMKVQAAAGTYNFNLPTSAGTSGQPLLSGGGGSSAHTYGTLGVAAGGTGQTSYTDGQLLIGNSSGNTLTKATLTAGAGITVTNGNGSISIASSGSAPIYNYTSQTTTYAATISDYVVASSSSFTITLPTAVGNAGKSIIVQHAGSNLSQIYTINTTSSQTITGSRSLASGDVKLHTTGEVFEFTSDGANWLITRHKTDNTWVTYTPTLNTGAVNGSAPVNLAKWRRDGPDMIIRWQYAQTAGGTAGSGAYTFTIPSNSTQSIDTTNFNTGKRFPCGYFKVSLNNDGITATTMAAGQAYVASSTTIGATQANISSGVYQQSQVDWGSSFYAWSNTTMNFMIECRVPMSTWVE